MKCPVYFLTDVFTRLTKAELIKDKKPSKNIDTKRFQCGSEWGLGSSNKFFIDNGEFNNAHCVDLCQNLKIEICSKGADSE